MVHSPNLGWHTYGDTDGACRRSWDVTTQDWGRIIIHAKSRDNNGQESDEVTRDVRVREPAPATTPTPTPTTPPTPTPTPTKAPTATPVALSPSVECLGNQ